MSFECVHASPFACDQFGYAYPKGGAFLHGLELGVLHSHVGSFGAAAAALFNSLCAWLNSFLAQILQ